MILANLKDISEQLPSSPALNQGIEFLRSNRWQGLPDGRVDIAGDDVYALARGVRSLLGKEDPGQGSRGQIT